MSDIMDVIDKLTENNQYATDTCLLLYLSDNYTTLHYLDYLDITGKDLETLVEDCCIDQSLDCITQTVRFLRSGFLGNDEIKSNLHSKNPITFIYRLLNEGENWEMAYEDYAGRFRSLNKPKTR